MAWNLTGELIESCSCNSHCPCWFGVKELMKMDKGWCDNTLLFRVSKGSQDGVDLGGTTVVFASDFPGPTVLDGNATARLHVDESASDDQRRKLEAIFRGEVGGPMEIIGGLVSKWLPSNYCKIDIEDDGDKLTAKVGDVGEIRSEVLKNDLGDAMTLKHAGFALAFQFDDAEMKIAPSGTRWSDPEMPRSYETHSGARAPWQWAVS